MTLPEPDFIARDPAAVTAEMVREYEAVSGKTLYPAQVERLLVDLVAYRETLVRIGIQEAAKQNLLAFARAPMIDYLGELLGIVRLPAQPARATVRLTFAEPAAIAFQIPSGARVETGSGIEFELEAAVTVTVGAKSVDVTVVAVEPGSAGNGYLPGQIAALIDELPIEVDTVVNLTASEGGTDLEDDEHLRARIRLAPESYSWGSANRYRLTAMSVAPDLVDVQVVSPRPDGSLNVILLGKDGPASPETVELVADALADPEKRMMGDRITVLAAEPVDYAIHLEIDVLSSHVPDLVLAVAFARCKTFADTLSQRLGGDIVPAKIKTALHDIDGLYDVRVLEPVGKRVLSLHEWPRCVDIDARLGGMIDDA